MDFEWKILIAVFLISFVVIKVFIPLESSESLVNVGFCGYLDFCVLIQANEQSRDENEDYYEDEGARVTKSVLINDRDNIEIIY